MRTTLTLDDDLATQLHDIARRKGETFKEVVNSTLRRGLHSKEKGSQPAKFKVTPKAYGFRPSVDVRHLNRLNDELEIEDFQRKRTGTGQE
jgi:hypothetical protein